MDLKLTWFVAENTKESAIDQSHILNKTFIIKPTSKILEVDLAFPLPCMSESPKSQPSQIV